MSGSSASTIRIPNPSTSGHGCSLKFARPIRMCCSSEAFTKPAMMHGLGKVGYQQSYTYFTWRNEKWEIEEYMKELTTETDSFFRPSFWVNTPDIFAAFPAVGRSRHSPFAQCSPQPCRRCGGSTRDSSCSRTLLWVRAARSTWTREVPIPPP